MFNIKILQNTNFKFKKEAYYKLGIKKKMGVCAPIKLESLKCLDFSAVDNNDYILELYI